MVSWLACVSPLAAQTTEKLLDHSLKPSALARQSTTGYSGTGANIDVVYHRAEWTVIPDATRNITGTVTTYFVTTKDNVSTINFDLNKSAFNNANLVVKYHGSTTGVSKSFPSSGNVNILNITLPATLPAGRLDSVTISYSGAPPAFSTYGEGYEEKNITGMGYVVYTLSESYGDEDWWPCKADMQDKIDSMDFIITTPSAFRAATNGVLVSDVVSGSNRIMRYKHRYPIPTYLVAIGVANYRVFDRGTVDINGTEVPIVYYIYSGRGTNPSTQLTAMDFCKQEMIEFSKKFGDYPFKNEKYGMYEFGWGGGMEHQTFSAMGWNTMSSWSVIAHELAHQWFGNKVTFATWNHLWLAEGFAKYLEVLAAELVPSLGRSAIAHRNGIKSTALSTATTPIYLSNATIANSNLIWTTNNDNAIYQRGAMVVSMLRKLAGDAKFFQACRNYLDDPALAYKSAVTDDLKRHFEAVLNYDLDAFFDDYIYGTGNPNYSIRWGNSGKRLNIQVASQTRSSGSTVSYFRSPIVIRASNGTKDTSIVIYDQNGMLSYAGNGISSPVMRNVLAYNLSFVPTTVTYDPDHETLTTGSIQADAALNHTLFEPLPVNILDFKGWSKDNGNLLKLTIVSNEEKKIITLQRSNDGVSFHSLGDMIEEQKTPSITTYSYYDKAIEPYKTYIYRVRTIDEQGIIKYSRDVKIESQMKQGKVRIIPNKSAGSVQVHLTPAWQKELTGLTIYNSVGSLIRREKIQNPGTSVTIFLGLLAPGTYTIELTGVQEKRLVKTFTVIP